jgi:hypothetical protein
MNIAEALNSANEISNWVHNETNNGKVKKDRRTMMSVSVFQHVLDTADGLALLIERNLPGVAWTLARPLHEGYTQAVWLLNYANEDQLTNYAKGICPKLNTLVKEIGDDPETGGAFIKGMTKLNISDFHNLTHGGIEHVSRRQTDTAIEPNYEEEELIRLLQMRNKYYTLVAFFLLTLMGKEESALELNNKLEAWSDAL